MSAGAWVQDIAQGTSSGSSSANISLTVSTAITAGNIIIVRVFAITSVGPTDCSISDNGAGYIWNQAAYYVATSISSYARTWVFYVVASNGLATGKTITVALSNLAGSENACNASASEYAGPFLASPFDKTTNNTSSSPTTSVASGTTATLSQASELAICAVGFLGDAALPGTPQTLTGTNGFSSRAIAQNGTTLSGVCALDKVLNSTSGVQATGTFGTSIDFTALIATFKLSTDPYPVGYPPPSRTWW